MDLLCGSEQKLGDLEDEMGDFLDNDMFRTPSVTTPDSYMDNDWFNSFFEDPVLNDKMITDAAQPPRITSEHSYSSTHNDQNLNSPLELGKLEDLDSDFLMSTNSALDLTLKQITPTSLITPKTEPIDPDQIASIATASPTITTRTYTVNNKQQPTIILATSAGQTTLSERSVLPKFTVKQEPPDVYEQYESLDQTVNVDSLNALPPTPPSSNNSDSDSCPSPQRSAPSSPIRHFPYSRHYDCSSSSSSISSCSLSPTSSCKPITQPLYTSDHHQSMDIVFPQIPQSGILVLSEEEKRTLISEGYPIPSKLPLTKQEEKNLKKIRRKIKNKISAQESRRKKKEYLETLEKRVESFSHENSELKKKVDNLENNNRSLLGQLQKLQSLVGKLPRAGSVPQTGTALMVLVLCFAVFIGSWSPTSLNIGYSTSKAGLPGDSSPFTSPQLVNPSPMMKPSVERAKVEDAYCTPNMKSRVLLSLRGEQEDQMWYDRYGPNIPEGEHDHIEGDRDLEQDLKEESKVLGFRPDSSAVAVSAKETEEVMQEASTEVKVVTMDARYGQNNHSSDTEEYQAALHPDLEVIAAAEMLKGDGVHDHAGEKIETA